MRDVLMISAEGGEMTLIDDTGQHAFDKIDVVRVTNYAQFSRVYDFIKFHCAFRDQHADHKDPGNELTAEEKLWKLQDMIQDPEKPFKDPERLRRYRTIIIDSLTEVEQYCMSQLLGVSDSMALEEEVQGAEWAEFKKQNIMLQRAIRSFRDKPVHVLLTCSRAYKEDEMKRTSYSPAMTGQLRNSVQGFVDLVGYLIMGQPKAVEGDEEPEQIIPRRLLIQPGPKYAAKSRFSNYRVPHFDDPTIGSILLKVGLIEARDLQESS